MFEIKDLDSESIREAVDARERFLLLRDAQTQARHSYGGSMKFERRNNAEYLIRRPYGSTSRKSLGRRSAQTEEKLIQFTQGKARNTERITALQQQLSARAPVLRARGLGRVPTLTARVLRKLDDLGWLGTSLLVLGTNALFAYEAAAAIRIETGLLATDDVDILLDIRRRLTLSGDVNQRGLVGALQSVDSSFERHSKRSYSASNKDGYLVDLIEPQDHHRLIHEGPTAFSAAPQDLVATTTQSSKWLLNVPKFEAVAFDIQGLPVRIVTIDPRVFALQKQWIVDNDPSRDPAKRQRDAQQAQLMARIALHHLGLDFADHALSGLPRSMRDLAGKFDISPPAPPQW